MKTSDTCSLRYSFSLVLIICLLLFSCNNGFVPAPVLDQIKNAESSADSSSVPVPGNLKASNGHKDYIALSWTSVDTAVQYQIFAADSPFSDFTLVDETEAGNTVPNRNVKVGSGVTRYYKIRAVDFSGKTSAFSSIVAGSTLAVPEITDIVQSSEGTSATIYWWMFNCTDATYRKNGSGMNITYFVEYDTSDAFSNPGTVKITSGETQVTVTGLLPQTNYWFRVSAWTMQYADESETSDVVDSKTAHRLIPDAPENVSATTGTSVSDIVLTWQAPSLVWVKTSATVYEEHPVFFTVERKNADAPDSAYTVIEECISAITTPGDYSGYEPGSTITWTDTTAVRGKQYTYRVWSYPDDVEPSKRVQSDTAFGTADGWLVSVPVLTARAEYSDNGLTGEESRFTSIDVDFDFVFETFGKEEYSYVLTQSYKSFDQGISGAYDNETIIGRYATIQAARNAACSFDEASIATTDVQGYYQYSLYILPISSQSNDIDAVREAAYAVAKAAGAVTVTDNPSLFVDISNFIIRDGFKDKFILTWDYVDSCGYSLSWNDGLSDDSQELAFTDDELTRMKNATASSPVMVIRDEAVAGKLYHTVSGSGAEEIVTAVFEHAVHSGDAWIYTLHANNGIERTKTADTKSETLGTARVTVCPADYSSIKVTWPAVQKAKKDGYSVSLVYDDDSGKELASDVTITEADDVCTCLIEKPAGFDDIMRSGKPMTLKVMAESEVSEAGDVTTSDPVAVRLLGPAMTGTAVTGQLNSSSISVSWNAVPGAGGYLIYRLSWKDTARNSMNGNGVTYFYDAEAGTLCADDEPVLSKRATVSKSGNSFTLTDIYCEADDETIPYQIQQAYMSLGLPFGYVVIPVKDKNSLLSCTLTPGSVRTVTVSSTGADAFTYSSALTPVVASTYGYGLNVTADKAENGKTVHLEWTKPYAASTPYVYRRPYNSTSNTWEYIQTSMPKDAVSVNIAPSGADRYTAFEYAVVYNATDLTALAPTYVASLESALESRYVYPSGTEPERANKGYLLAVDFSARYGGELTASGGYDASKDTYYSEIVEWVPWNTAERALAPTGYAVSILNRNIGSSWKSIGPASSNLTGAVASWNTQQTQCRLTPSFNASGYSTGDLTVLRDYKHYYKLTLTHTFTKDGSSVTATAETGADESVFAFRQIKPAELARCVGLIIADALTQAGIPSGGENKCTGEKGSFIIKHPGGTQKSVWGTGGNQYRHAFTAGLPGSETRFVSPWVITCANTGEVKNGANYNNLYILGERTLKVECDCPLGTYRTDSFVFSASSDEEYIKLSAPIRHNLPYTVKITIDGVSVLNSSGSISKIEDNENYTADFLHFFPFRLGVSCKNGTKSRNTSYPLYTGDWWGGQ